MSSHRSNDSNSDNDSRRNQQRHPGPPPPFIDNKPKKKKKRLPPQETINKIWSRFSVPKFSKATKILPFAAPPTQKTSKTSAPLQPAPDNLLVSEDYERAVQECRKRVHKLIKECKRVNMRYRDSDFDIDWDLKWEKGYCLNGLGDEKFEINGRAFANPTANVPKAVKRVHEIFENPTFLKEKVSPADVKQGSLGDCWLMASLTALANMEDGIKRICVEYDTKIGIYGFVFHRDGEWIISIIDDKLYLKSPDWDSPSVQRHLLEQTDREDVEKEYRKTYQTGSQALFFAHCKDQQETWLPLLEKAYAKAHGDYAAMAGGWIGEGVEDLTGGVTTELLTSDILDIDEFWNNEIMKVNKEFLFGCSTGLLDGGYGSRDGISEGHAYVIMEARELSDGKTRLLKLRNPWGKGKKGNWEGAWSDGSKEFTPEAQIELNHTFGNDSVFWISYPDLLRKYQHFDRTRLFMDSPDWRLTQKWISVEVPWKAEFEQRFRIVLKKESPVVLVLSQLDDRYFDGLQGQYSFRLQFRLHEVDSLGEEDYIVRSHGNYLMERSVVTELKSLKAGTYAVFIMVVADRDTIKPSVEEVVKAECRRRVDNDKLIQVGTSYDLSHSKATAHMESVATVRKAHDKRKARESRIAQRRKLWEKRRLTREITRKQEKKNREKRERKEVKDLPAAERKADERKDRAMQTDEAKDVKFEKEDKGIQTDEPSASNKKPEEQSGTPPKPKESTMKDNDKAVQTIDISASSTTTQGTPSTPKSSPAHTPSAEEEVIVIRNYPSDPHSNHPPPPPPPQGYTPRRRSSLPAPHPHLSYSRGPPPPQRIQYMTSEGESSASPISDYEDMYSDDDPTLGPRLRPIPAAGQGSGRNSLGRSRDSEEEDDAPDPWNAVCVLGFRVYGRDEGLEVRIWEGEAEGEEEVVVEKEMDDDGTDGDVEDEGDSEKTKKLDVKVGDKKSDVYNASESQLPIRPKEADEPSISINAGKNPLETETINAASSSNQAPSTPKIDGTASGEDLSAVAAVVIKDDMVEKDGVEKITVVEAP